MKDMNIYVSPSLETVELQLESNILTASGADVEIKDWEDVEIC
jgi:hypothetical protein